MEPPEVLNYIATEFDRLGIPPLIVGGFAINEYGVTRNTLDIDFMILKENVPKAIAALQKVGYSERSRTGLFIRMKGPAPEWMDVDFIFVDRPTLEKILKEGRKVRVGKIGFTVPKIDHLIAMKLHSIKNNPRRMGKDFMDILALIEAKDINIKSTPFKKLCLEYGSEELYSLMLKTMGGVK